VYIRFMSPEAARARRLSVGIFALLVLVGFVGWWRISTERNARFGPPLAAIAHLEQGSRGNRVFADAQLRAEVEAIASDHQVQLTGLEIASELVGTQDDRGRTLETRHYEISGQLSYESRFYDPTREFRIEFSTTGYPAH
jgi:hypothetical protein